ncbi:MFS transporter [Oceanobacillus oncorhynchi subsp. incaldanensis]|uniref:MFS transporter n=2 Tax=Oceanobacillus TaxID=182709 RepID=A0ABV9JV37_9BACI|nr:MFS transporter [Oceanobacillus oncorhynchi]MDM8099008.1 MFS transporter [Oceanobacillus oncorhynchi]GIO20280.1 MFS transporter [Oceanobacillus oncorhynchi subsp. incaldanensis]CEI80576.1 Putative bacilysin exporter BacE [Oceanobacillus oncorhynchi]
MEAQPLFKNRTFVLLFVAGIFGVVSFSMFLTTTTWFVISDSGSASSLGLVLIAATVPRISMMIFGGVVADRYKKTTIMFLANFVQAILLLVLYILIKNDALSLTLLLLIAAGFGMLDAFFGPASSSMIPKIVEKSQLQRANALFQGVDQISFVAGPIVAGVLMESIGVGGSYFVAMILALLSAVIIYPRFINEGPVSLQEKQKPIKEIKEGLAYIRNSSFLMTGLVVLITLNFFVFGTLHIAIPFLVESYGGTPLNLSYMEASLGIGLVAGTGILSSVLVKKKGRTSLFGLLGALIAYVIFALVPNLTMLTIVVFFIGFSMSFVFIPFFTAAQEQAEDYIMGRVMSIIFLAMNGFDPISYALVSGLSAANIPIQAILLGFGMLGLIITAVLFTKAKTYKSI